MTAYTVFEVVVIAAIGGWSLNRVLRQMLPAAHRAAHGWIAARLGLKPPAAPAASGCGSGCGSCATGCGTPARTDAKPVEEPVQFYRRKA